MLSECDGNGIDLDMTQEANDVEPGLDGPGYFVVQDGSNHWCSKDDLLTSSSEGWEIILLYSTY